MQFYREPRVTRVTGREGWPNFFEFTISDEGEAPNGDALRSVTKTPFKQMVNPETRETQGFAANPEKTTKTHFDFSTQVLNVSPASASRPA